MKDLLWWLLIVGLAGAGIFFVPKLLVKSLGTDNPTLTVISGSMWPALHRGDLIFVSKVPLKDIKVGTVLVFRHGNGLAVHRVVKIQGNTITTKGDANPEEDAPFDYDKVVGRVPIIGNWLVKVPYLGMFSILMGPPAAVSQDGKPAPGPGGPVTQLGRYLGSPVGIMLLLAPVALLLLSFMGDIMLVVRVGPGRARWHKKRAERLKRRRVRPRFA